MAVQGPLQVNISPELEQKVEENPDALLCVAGLAYATAVLIENGKLPDFKQSLTITLDAYLATIRKVSEEDFVHRGEEEVERFRETARLWKAVGYLGWEGLGVIQWNYTHTKVNLKKDPKRESVFNLNIGPFGKRR